MKKVRKKLSIGARVRRNSQGGSMGGEVKTEVKTVSEVDTADSIHVDEISGRRYSYNKKTDQTQWLADDDKEGEAPQGETKNHSAADSIHVDERSGRRYSYNKETDQTQWLTDDDQDDDEKGEATQGETKNHSTKRKSFRKIVGGKDDYFVNVETGEAVWYVPEDGEEVSW